MGNSMNDNGWRLDEKLAESEPIAGLVRSLPEESVSMAWRSALNERVLAESARRQKSQRIAWVWRPAAGLAVASGLAMALLFKSAPVESPPLARVPIEASLLDLHREAVVASEVSGQTPSGVPEEAPKLDASTNPWTEDDLNNL